MTQQQSIETVAREYAAQAPIESPQLAAIRATAAKRFQELAWPTQSEEEWRRTAIDTIGVERFYTTAADTTAISAPKESEECLKVYRGIATIAKMPAERLSALCDLFEKRIASADNRFILWPYLFLNDVIVIDIGRNYAATEPIRLTTTIAGDARCATPLLCIFSECEREACVLHTIASSDDSSHLCVSDSVTDISDGGRVQTAHNYRLNINSYQFGNGWARLGRDAYLRHGVVSVGGLLTKLRYDAHLVGAGGEAYLDGVYLGHEDQHHDLCTLQVHDAPSTNSFAFYRGVILDEAHTIYQGLIRVTERANGTDAYLTNNNLLLSDEARSDSIPSLNISTDEVKCSHGSTSGNIDPLQIFYLQSRGMSYHDARALLVEGFVEEVLRHFPQEVREEVSQKIKRCMTTLAQ